MNNLSAEDLDFLISLTQQACVNILKYRNNELAVKLKNDDEYDPLTLADESTDHLLRGAILERFIGDQILSEENANLPSSYEGRVWMIDPLDGTKEFVDGGVRFAVMIGLCVNGTPVFGVVGQPTSGDVYYAVQGQGAYLLRNDEKRKLQASDVDSISESTLLVSRQSGEPRESETFLRNLPFKAFQEDSSFGLRAGLIAEGTADIFVGTNVRASKWDVCAPQVILEEAGGSLTLLQGDKIDYKQLHTKIGQPFMGTNGYLAQELLPLLKEMPQA